MPSIELRWESVDEFWPEGEPLMRQEYDECSSPGASPFAPDRLSFDLLERHNLLFISTARVNGALGAYLFWSLGPNLESHGERIASQGLWYSARRFRRWNLGISLLRWSLPHISAKAALIELHHPTGGRGARLGPVFRRLGASPCNSTFLLRSVS
jgi:hypothetical protein